MYHAPITPPNPPLVTRLPQDLLVDFNQFLGTQDRNRARAASSDWRDTMTCLPSRGVYRTNLPCPPYASTIETYSPQAQVVHHRCCALTTASDVRFLNAVASIAYFGSQNPDLYQEMVTGLGENFADWFFRNSDTLTLTLVAPASIMQLDNRETWFDVFLGFLFSSAEILNIREVGAGGPLD